MQLAGCCYTFTCYARNIGLCPHRKNHRLGRWIFIVCFIFSFCCFDLSAFVYCFCLFLLFIAFIYIPIYLPLFHQAHLSLYIPSYGLKNMVSMIYPYHNSQNQSLPQDLFTFSAKYKASYSSFHGYSVYAWIVFSCEPQRPA